jgi:large subunit ribosomal protein L20
MPRVKRGKQFLKRRTRILKRTKGFGGRLKKLIRAAKVADIKAGAHAYRDRRVKKRVNRRASQVRINAGARENGVSYSVLMGNLKKKGIKLNRTVLAQIANTMPEVFKKLVAASTK